MNFEPTLLTEDELLILLVVVGLVLLFFYRYTYRVESRSTRRLTGRQVLGLWALRVFVASLGLLALAKPAVFRVRREVRTPVVAFLVDKSDSMGFPASRGQPFLAEKPRRLRTRFDVAQEVVTRLQAPLSESHRVKVYTFADTLELLREVPQREAGEAALPLEEIWAVPEDREKREKDPSVRARLLRAKGDYSNIGDAVEDGMTLNSGDRISGIVLISDGRITGGRKLAKVRELAANAEPPVPIYTIATGTQYPLRDLAIEEVMVPREASLGDVLTFHLMVNQQIASELTTTLTLYEEGEPIEKPVTIKRGRHKISIATIPEVEGTRTFKLTLPVQPDEVNTENNEYIVPVEIVKRSLRVILIGGKPSREYIYMVPALLRDPVIKLSCYLQEADVDYVQQGNTNIDRLPRTTREWETFDVAILQDINPNKITNVQIAGLDNMVGKGGGLIVQGGRNYGLAKLLQVHATRIRTLLPVEIDKNRHPDHDRYFAEPIAVRRTPEGRGHPVMFADADADVNEWVWKRFPAFFWGHPVLSVKSQAVVLLETDSSGESGKPDCLMATQRIGEGRVFFCALDSLWRWRYPHESYDYDRFWTRVVRYVGEARLPGKQRQVALETRHNVYSPGEDVEILLHILDPSLMKQLATEEVYVSVVSPKGAKHMVRLRPRPDREPVYEGVYVAQTIGRMKAVARQIAPDADSEQAPLFEVDTVFDVKMQSLELKETSADLEALEELARLTGGQAFDYRNVRQKADVDKLVEHMSKEPQVLKATLPIEVWDGSIFLGLFLVLVSSEWCLRKWWGLL